MSRKGIYKISIKILQLCLVLGSSFKVLVEFSLSSAAQLLKLRLQTKASLTLFVPGEGGGKTKKKFCFDILLL